MGAATRAQVEAEGKYYPCVGHVVLYTGEPTKCSGKTLAQGTQGTVVEVTSESIRVKWTGFGPMSCTASVLKMSGDVQAQDVPRPNQPECSVRWGRPFRHN